MENKDKQYDQGGKHANAFSSQREVTNKENKLDSGNSSNTEIKKLKKKNKLLKENLKRANGKIMELLTEKMSKLTTERQANIPFTSYGPSGLNMEDGRFGARDLADIKSMTGMSSFPKEGILPEYNNQYNKASSELNNLIIF